jgi:hypothetical protein
MTLWLRHALTAKTRNVAELSVALRKTQRSSAARHSNGDGIMTRAGDSAVLPERPQHLCLRAFLLLAIVGNAASGLAQLRAGAAKSMITPELEGHKVYLAGFGHNRVATAEHDPLYVRCLAVKAGKETLALCAADLIGLFYDDVGKIRARFAERAPKGALLIVASTHVHEGPDTLGLWGPTAEESGMDPGYLDWLDNQIASTALEAVRAMRPARLRLARDDHPLLAQLQGVDRPPYVKDPFLFVLQAVRASDGAAIATLVNWTDHPETLNRKNTVITSDYPHWICNYLEHRYGGTAVFVNGALGKVSTLGKEVSLLDPETGQPAEDGSFRKPELLGTMIGRLAERALARAERVSPDAWQFHSSVFFLPLANDRFRAAEAAGIFRGRKPLYTSGRVDASIEPRDVDGKMVRLAGGHDLQTEVDYVELKAGARLLAEFVTIPGEAFPEVVNGGVERYPGADFPDAPLDPPLRAILRSKYQFVIGLGNDELGYIIPKAEWDERPPWLNNSPKPFYGEINSPGPDTAAAIIHALADLVTRALTAQSGDHRLR